MGRDRRSGSRALSCPIGLVHTHLPPWPEGVAAQTGPEAPVKDQDPGLGGRLSSTHFQLYLCKVQVKSCGNDEQLAMASPRWGRSAAPRPFSPSTLVLAPCLRQKHNSEVSGTRPATPGCPLAPLPVPGCGLSPRPSTPLLLPLVQPWPREASPAVLGDRLYVWATRVLKCRTISHGTVTSCWEEISGLHAAPS